MVALLLIAACGELERKPGSAFNSLFYAKVVDKKPVVLEANESKSGRVLVGLLSAGVVGAIATATTEDGFSEPKAFSYTLLEGDQKPRTIVSYSVVSTGDCVEAISPDDSAIDILRVAPSADCPSLDTAAASPQP